MKDALIKHIEEEVLSGRGSRRVTEDEDLLGSGILDSLGVMTLVFFIEKEFQVDVPPQDVTIENFVSVAAIDAYLRQRKSE